MIDFSAKRKGRAKDEKLEPRQLAVAELMAWGWDPTDAMLAVGLVQESDTKLDAQHAAVNFTANEDFDAIYKKRVKQLRNGAVLDEYQKLHPTPGSTGSNRGRPRADGTSSERKLWEGPLDEPATDEEILSAMWSTITKLKPEDPKRVDLLDKYDKLKRRQQGNKEDDTTIHFYLPRPECDTCPFRGNHVITEPEKKAETPEPPKPDPEEDEFEPRTCVSAITGKPIYTPQDGYSKNGKKLGRPRKRKKKAASSEAQKEEV
jgi:hypothetical protein